MLGAAWEKNLDALVEDGRPVDIVTFTGDLADWGLSAEYATATPFFDAILARLGLGRERLFVVPGNHDIQRKTQEDVWRTLRRDLPRVSARERSAWMAGKGSPLGVEEGHRDAILERERGFWSWLGGEMGRPELLPGRSPHKRLGYRSTLRLPGRPFDIHVIGLDSAWLAGDEADAGKLLLTEDQIGLLATSDDGRSLPGFRLALVHHPLSALSDERASRDLLAEHADLLLRGHLHEPDVITVSTTDQDLRQLAAGSLYEGDMANAWPNACHLIDVSLDAVGRPLSYDLRLRGYSDRGAGHWYDDGSLSPSAANGRLRWEVRRAAAPPASPPAIPSKSATTGAATEATTAPPLVFLLAHKDASGTLEALKRQLAPLERQGALAAWDAASIAAGKLIKAETDAALARATIAVILVSPGLLVDEAADASISALLSRGTPIVCLYVTHTIADLKEYSWISTESSAKQMFKLTEARGLNDPEKPLKDLEAPAQEGVLAKAVVTLVQALQQAKTAR